MDSISSIWLDLLRKYRLIAVIRVQDLDLGLKMAQAVAQAGISLIEITWNSCQPQALINQLRQELPDCYIGAGTILTLPQLQEAINSGSQFVFSPHLNGQLLKYALKANIPMIPGTLSPTEIVRAFQGGASCVKVFPIKSMGGVDYIKSLQGPLGHIPLIPTGGVTIDNSADFIQAGAIAIGLSSQLFPPPLLSTQNWSLITERAFNLQKKLQNIRLN
jgi:2-dehydro-3-deoxyphosphogluconate aldolase/(4S)-4-hydroxy-2-oxoglutarate aldolase